MIVDQSIRSALFTAFDDILMNAGPDATASAYDLVEAAAAVMAAATTYKRVTADAVLPHEADSYPCSARTDPEVFSMPDSVLDPEVLMHEQNLRLACLERAGSFAALGAEPETFDVIIARAKAYADFVIGKSNG
ncbi:hypothetical protein [Sphingomonas paucimobilis]|uniref:hypothetical protein n=1 Tax=Sphingomonas paucimobilis TaxID=13689 RepID=UPI00203BCB7B|nr:hypothetical protein [Sphingomonas paucimobilis]MCM3679454.1 hypothetical protein [Sphingomonas paucimobilis]